MRLSHAGRRTRLLTGAATGLALLSFAGVAAAQTAGEADPATDEVVVTGIRAAIQNSIAVKKNETSIVEVISAEDIGKLPDQSIADSLSRLPGLATQRLDGRAQVISVRGLSPDFTTSLLNGREQVSTGDNRGVEFDQYPSELLNQVVVYKTPDASLIGHGLAGTVDLRTVRPLAYGKRALAASARYEWNGYDAKNPEMDNGGERITLSYIDQFMDGRLGVALGYSHISTTFQIERYRSWGFPGGPGNALVLGGAQVDAGGSTFDRDGYIATVEFKPADNLTTTLDVFYSEFENNQILRGMELPLQWSSASLQPGFTTSNGLITSGTFNGVKAVLRTDYNARESTNLAVGWNTRWNFADNWTAEADVALSKVERDERVLEVYSGTGRNGFGATDNITYTFGDTGAMFRSTLNYADRALIQLTSPQGWGAGAIPGQLAGGQDGFDKTFTVEDELESLRLSARREGQISIFSGFEFGANINGRNKTYAANEFFIGLKANPANVPIPNSAYVGTTSLAHVGIPGVVAFDPVAVTGSLGLYNYFRNVNGDVRNKDWVVDETVLTGYAKADIDTVVGGLPLTGNVGLQVVNTRQTSGAFQTSDNGPNARVVPVKGGDEYTEVLPSLNLIFELPSDQLLRVGAARTLARPRMDQMKAGGSFSFAAANSTCPSFASGCSPWSGNAGNPALRPWIATGLDLSYEKYFGGREGYVSLALFYKELESYVFTQRVLRDFTGFPTIGATGPVTVFQGLVDTPQNGSGGELRGAEGAISLPLEYVWAPLEGFGVFASASFTESSIQPNPGNAAEPIPGLSKWVTNLTAYYEKDGFQARVSQRYRTGFRGELSGFANGREIDWVKEETIVDAQLGYEFQSGPLEGLSILAQGYNLTDEPFVVLEGNNPRLIKRYQEYGPTYSIGVSYRF